MDTVTQLYILLEEKKERFSLYEETTLGMLHCEVEDIEDYITKRGLLANEIDENAQKIERICEKDQNGALLYQAALARVNYDQIPPEMQLMYEQGQQILGIISRIQNSEKQISERLEALKAEALDKIKENQNLPKIKKYLVDLGESVSKGTFTSGKA